MTEKFLWYPVVPFFISQHFGEDRACVSSDGKTTIAKETTSTCPEGFKSLYEKTNGHNGLDLRAKRWQPVYACHDGIVNEVQTEEARGLGLGIVTDKKYFCEESGKPEYFKTRYWHFISLDAHLGDKVKTGDFIGYADSTGFSTGDHLHLELKPVTIDMYENGVPVTSNVLQNNSHLGSINPLTYMENASALEAAGLVKQIAELSARIADFVADRLRRK